MYEVTFKKEILKELASSIFAKYCNYIIKNGLDSDNLSNEVVKKYHEVIHLDNKIVPDNKSLPELENVEVKLLEYREYIEYLLNKKEGAY